MFFLKNAKMNKILIRRLKKEDCKKLSDGFVAQGWGDKPESQYLQYLEYQASETRDILVAEYENEIAGYLTIKWKSNYPSFKAKQIPEIVDFNVYKKFQRKGIGSVLMDEAESRIKLRFPQVGIGFGITKDYGAAQILYIKRGYIPDGNGLVKNFKRLDYGEKIIVNHDLAMYLTKKLD